MISKQTTLDLNGPILSFSLNPVGVATSSTGSVTLTGIATALFPVQDPPNQSSNTGIIAYRWYEVGFGELRDGANILGSGTPTLTLSNLITPTDNNRQFYLSADYIPSAYQSSTPIIAGTARSTGNAINEPFDSNIASITVFPLLQIFAQPTDRQALVNNDTTFTIGASLTDNSFRSGLSYQWYVNGIAVNDGILTTTTTATQVDQTYTSNSSITLPTDSENITVTVAGASGGAGGADAGGSGGSGGSGRVGTFLLTNGPRTLTFNIGRRGNAGGSGNFNAFGSGGSSSVAAGGRGGGAGGSGWSGGGGGGGGATGVLDSSVNSYIIVAGGGGGGGGGSLNRGGSGGSSSGTFSSSSGPFAISGGSQGQDKSGDGGGGGGGGGGATGGGGGGAGQDNSFGGGGGSGAGSRHNSNIATLQSQTQNGSDGYANIKFITQTSIPGVTVEKTLRTTVSGTKTPTLTIRGDSVGIQTVRCIVSNQDATNSPILSNIVNFATVSDIDQFNINVEAIGVNNTATISSINLFNGDYEFVTTGSDVEAGRITFYYSFYAPDKNINVEMDLYGGKGLNNGIYSGGEGGFSRIRFTMVRNTEYVIAGLSPRINTPFIYRKGSLIATVGAGGNAGTLAKGGFGGGIGIGGQNGFGRDGGSGGTIITTGNLPSNGIFGSATNLVAISPDTKASVPNGGRVLACTRGVYWRQQGFTSCQDVGTTQFRLSDGTIVTNTASITRGFKSGYGINETAGAELSNGGRGGSGATGGGGGLNGSGGGGGSGYTDGSVTVISSQLGGSVENTKVILRVVT
jgi:hypothetical protein